MGSVRMPFEQLSSADQYKVLGLRINPGCGYVDLFWKLLRMKVNRDQTPPVDIRILHSNGYNLLELATPVTTSENCDNALLISDEKLCQIVEKPEYGSFRDHLRSILIPIVVAAIFFASLTALLAIKSFGPCSYNTVLSFNKKEIIPYISTRNLTIFQPSDDQNGTRFRVSLFGDSLISRPALNLDLNGKIKSFLPQFELEITNVASSGSKIFDMRSKLGDILDLEAVPHAVILYWDSDVSDVDESKMTADEVDDLRTQYRDNLSFTLSQLVLNISYVAVAGPGILGEGPMFMPKSDRFTKDKSDMLNSYREINKEIATQYDCPYIDMRQAFLDAIPSYRLNYKHCVTYDGEHENEYGTLIVADLMSKTLFEWLERADAENDSDDDESEEENDEISDAHVRNITSSLMNHSVQF